MFDFQSGSLDSFQKEQPIGEIWIDQYVQVGELQEKRGMADPRDRHLATAKFWERGLPMLPGSPRQQRFPDHFPEKGARIEMLGRSEILKCPRQRLLLARRPIRLRSLHITAYHVID